MLTKLTIIIAINSFVIIVNFRNRFNKALREIFQFCRALIQGTNITVSNTILVISVIILNFYFLVILSQIIPNIQKKFCRCIFFTNVTTMVLCRLVCGDSCSNVGNRCFKKYFSWSGEVVTEDAGKTLVGEYNLNEKVSISSTLCILNQYFFGKNFLSQNITREKMSKAI